MSIFEVSGGRITHRYLTNKSKSDLARIYMDLLDRWESSQATVARLEAELANVDRLRGVRLDPLPPNRACHIFIVDIDDDPPPVQWYGAGRTVREALRNACAAKDAKSTTR